jgi:DNA repair exonuclease SbcCD ATPase subunit
MAEIGFEHGHSLQLVGPNNVGKSSLIYALNFLFLVNKKLMNFSGQRTADKETLAHYFPSPEQSYILFELEKRGRRYCMLVHRDGESNLLYTRLECAYERALLFEQTDKGQKLRPYKTLAKHLIREKIKLKKYDQVQEILKHIYQLGDKNDAVVWLTDKCKISGTYNSFNKVYRYLINSKLIDNRALKDILLIADNRDQDELSYSRQNIQQIDKLRYQSQQLAILKNIKTEFEQFKVLVGQVEQLYSELCQQAATFQASARLQRAKLLEVIQEKRREAEQTQEELLLKSRENDDANQQKGRLAFELEQEQQAIGRINQQTTRILALPAEPLLRQQLENQQKNLDQIWFRLQQFSANLQQEPEALEARLVRLDQSIAQKEAQKNDIDNWLVAHLGKTEEARKLLNTILSPEVARLSREHIEQEVSKIEELIHIFDGKIRLPKNFPIKEMDTPEQIAEELEELRMERTRIANLLDTSRNQEELKKQLQQAKTERSQLEAQLHEVKQLPELNALLKKHQATSRQLARQLAQQEQACRELQETLQRLRNAIQLLQEENQEREQAYQQLERDQRDIEEMELPLTDADIQELARKPETMQALMAEVKRLRKHLQEKREAKNRLFLQLREKTQFDLANEQQYIRQLEQEVLSVKDKERSIEGLLESIAVQFANPAQRFLDAYEEFKAFTHNEFNRTLGAINISNIESLSVVLEPNERLQADLRSIAELSLTTEGLFRMPGHTAKRLDILREYLEKGQAIAFRDLFHLQLKLTINGKVRSVNLGKQVESDGTDRMLRLIIVMAVISRLSHRSPDNRIVLFIDEIATIDGKNRPQLVDFCRTHHFYPIFAAPDIVDGFDQYVLIQRQEGGQLVIDEQKHIIQVKRKKEETIGIS